MKTSTYEWINYRSPDPEITELRTDPDDTGAWQLRTVRDLMVEGRKIAVEHRSTIQRDGKVTKTESAWVDDPKLSLWTFEKSRIHHHNWVNRHLGLEPVEGVYEIEGPEDGEIVMTCNEQKEDYRNVQTHIERLDDEGSVAVCTGERVNTPGSRAGVVIKHRSEILSGDSGLKVMTTTSEEDDLSQEDEDLLPLSFDDFHRSRRHHLGQVVQYLVEHSERHTVDQISEAGETVMG